MFLDIRAPVCPCIGGETFWTFARTRECVGNLWTFSHPSACVCASPPPARATPPPKSARNPPTRAPDAPILATIAPRSWQPSSHDRATGARSSQRPKIAPNFRPPSRRSVDSIATIWRAIDARNDEKILRQHHAAEAPI